jgi:hypothetical protein
MSWLTRLLLGKRSTWQEEARRTYEVIGAIPKDYRPTPAEKELMASLFQRVSWVLRRWRG